MEKGDKKRRRQKARAPDRGRKEGGKGSCEPRRKRKGGRREARVMKEMGKAAKEKRTMGERKGEREGGRARRRKRKRDGKEERKAKDGVGGVGKKDRRRARRGGSLVKWLASERAA